ncbi:MAG: hypothetical protein AAF636_14305 [Pseudomonadota bacterium]
MPDFDSGHIFLTTLAPIKNSSAAGHKHTSFTQDVRIALAQLSPALQSPATEKIGVPSPFARNQRTHLARMFVLNDTIYNGRVGKNAIHASLTGESPEIPKPVDRLNTSYLVFCADIDAVEQDGAPLPKELSPTQQRRVRDAYAHKLWETMGEELSEVYSNCEGFDGVETSQDFADYLNSCRVETTMPFHDYYLKLPAFSRLPVIWLLMAIAIPALWMLVSLVLRLFGVIDMPFGPDISTLASFILGAVATGIVGYGLVNFALKNGSKPLPPGEYDDLPSVLKALYTQQRFADFAVNAQGMDPEVLHRQFGDFLSAHRPSDRDGPTQLPGVVRTPQT